MEVDREGEQTVQPALDRGQVFEDLALRIDQREAGKVGEGGKGGACQLAADEKFVPAVERGCSDGAFQIVGFVEQVLAARLALAAREGAKSVEAAGDG